MKYMIMMGHAVDQDAPDEVCTPEEAEAGWKHMQRLYQDLVEAGELVATEKLAGPQAAKFVTSGGVNAPVVTDGVFPEAKEYLAGFWMVDVDSEERAIEIAARTSAAPGAGGKPTATRIEVRPVMGTPTPEW
jgi:hypothetical protein